MTKAAVFNAVQEPLTIEDIDIAEPIDREVLVRTAASGVCHSDLHFIEGLYPMPNRAILGHEAAGIVEAVGPNVTEVEPGPDAFHVIEVEPSVELRRLQTVLVLDAGDGEPSAGDRGDVAVLSQLRGGER